MKRLGFAVIIAATILNAQEPGSIEKLTALSDQLSSAVAAGDWEKASELSKELAESTVRVRNASLTRSTTEQLTQLLRWLPEDTETLLVAGEPFSIGETKPNAMLSGKALAQGYVTGLLQAPGAGKLYESLSGQTLRYGVLAARRFGHHPDDGSGALPLGMIAYQGCGAYGFEQPIDRKQLEGAPSEEIMDHIVRLMEGKQYQQARNARPQSEIHFITLLKPDQLLVCNSKELFTEVLERINSPKSARALPDTLPEWKYIDRSAPVWGLRHIARQRSAVDPSLGDMVIHDDQAIGMALQVDVPPGEIQMFWLSGSKANPWGATATNPQFKDIQTVRVGENLWKISGKSMDVSAYMLIFAVMAAMGFVVLV